MSAHQDPHGDIYPWVTVSHGLFQVIFHAYGEDYRVIHHYRIIYSPEGTVIVPRHPLDDKEFERVFGAPKSFHNQGEVKLPRIEQVHPDGKTESSPFAGRELLELVDKVNGVTQRDPLPMDTSKLGELRDYWVNATHAGILWTKMERPNADAPDTFLHDLCITWFRRGDFSEPVTKSLGEPATIYDFAVASNLVWARGRLWVAWMRRQAKLGVGRVEAVLSSYDPVTDQVETKLLKGPAHWNSHLSMATTDGWLCVAWHCSVDGTYPGTAQIITVFEKLPEQTPAQP